MFCSVCWKHPSVFVFSTTCKIRRHVFTTFNACIRNVKCKNKNVPEVLKSSKQISFFESRQSKILLFVMRVAAFFWVLTVHHPVVFVMTPSSATTNLFWRRFFFFGQVDFVFGQPESAKLLSDGQVKWKKSFLLCQASFREEASGGVAKCWLFSQAKKSSDFWK